MRLKSLPIYIWIVVTIASLLLYIPVNQFVTLGFSLEQPIDKLIPVIPIFVIPYLFGLIFWPLTILLVNLKKDRITAIKFDIKIILAGVLSSVIYLVIPTFVTRPEITGTDIFSNVLKIIYANDRVYNAAPSGHTFYALLCMIVLNKSFPKYKILWSTISVLIILSTVFTKQHNVLDVVFGIIFALLINFVANKVSLKSQKLS